jgi:hypothetical protein
LALICPTTSLIETFGGSLLAFIAATRGFGQQPTMVDAKHSAARSLIVSDRVIVPR